MTIFKLLREDVTKLQTNTDTGFFPVIEVKGSCQFIHYVKSLLNETSGVPTLISQVGCCTIVKVYKLGTFKLVIDDTITAGYTAKILCNGSDMDNDPTGFTHVRDYT